MMVLANVPGENWRLRALAYWGFGASRLPAPRLRRAREGGLLRDRQVEEGFSTMGFARFAWMAILACGAAAAYGIYAPEATDRWVPPAGGVAHQLHNRIWTPPTQNAAAPGQGQGQSGGPAPIVVTVTPVKRADFPVVLESIGQVQAYNTVLVRARVDGQIEKIAFNEGQVVKQGDLLAQIDPRPFQAALDQAVAKKAQDEATVANAKLDLTRYATLAKQNFATQQQLDTQNSLVNQLIATIAADSAAIDAAKVQLDYTTIRAPISGRVGFRLIDEGNLVHATDATGLVVVTQLQPISVIFTLPESELAAVRSALKAGPVRIFAMSRDDNR